MKRLLGVLSLFLLSGCATAADIKPGIVRGVDDGYVKTTEGFGIVTQGCPDGELWATVLETARTFRPSGHVFDYGPLVILSADENEGVIHAHDPMNFWRKGSYVGLFIHHLTPELRLIEASSFWDTRTVVLKNPWERDLLGELVRKLPCVVPSEQAILRAPGGAPGRGRLPSPTPSVQPATSSPLFCRQRAANTRGAGSWSAAWSEAYRRCMEGY